MENAIDTAWKMLNVKSRLLHKTMADGSTSLDALLPSPQGPQSAPPVYPESGSPGPSTTGFAPSFKPSLPAMTFMFRNLQLYIAFFVSTFILSLATPRNLLLQYIPSAYTSNGVVSYQGAAVIGAASVVLGHFVNVVLTSFLG
jgi:hypothetical protein